VQGKYVICELWINYVAESCPLDIIFVLDESQSVGPTNYEKMKTFVSQLVGTLDVKRTGGALVGVVTFGTYVNKSQVINLKDHPRVADLQAAINKLSYAQTGTGTDVALNYVHTDMLTLPAGDRDDVPNVVIVMTDGESSEPTATKVCKMLKLFVRMRQLSHCDCVSKMLIICPIAIA